MERMKPSVFVLMPFKHRLVEGIYDHGISPACEEAGAYCKRIDTEIVSGRITEEIYNQIDRADILVADVTGLNPNVYYEVGFAHGLGKNVIFIKHIEDNNAFQFDTQDFQHIIYSNASHLQKELVRRITHFTELPELTFWNSDFHKRRKDRSVPKTYRGFTEASYSMERLLKPLLSRPDEVNIKLMGMALHKSFPLVASLIEDVYLDKQHSQNLRLDLAVIRKEWIIEKGTLMHQDWKDRLETFEVQFNKFQKKAANQVSISLYRFHHLPYLHGMLINNRHLFLGHCSWDGHDKLTVGANAYQEFNGDVLEGNRMIEQFNGWFKYCVNEHRYYAQHGSHSNS